MSSLVTPTWALALSYWLHMLATVLWIGGLSALVILVLPAARSALDATGYAALLGQIQRRLNPIGWFCLLLLIGTGMLQLIANQNYHGFLAIENQWAIAILLKHILFFSMIGLSTYITWGLMPQLHRLALRQARGQQNEESENLVKRLHRQEVFLLRINLALGVLILALTAIARST